MAVAGIWLVFLVFPVTDLLRLDSRPRAIGFALMAVFVACYLSMLRRLGVLVPVEKRRHQVMWFSVLVLVTLASSSVLGMDALGYLPFLVAAAGFGLWTPANRIVSAVVLIAGLATTVVMNTTGAQIGVLLAGVLNLVSAWLVTGMIERGERASRSERQLLVVEERNRIASDVHDLLGHSLTVVNLKLQLVERLLDSDPERARRELAEVRGIVTEALGGVRQTVSMERSTSLADEIAQAREALTTAGVEVEVVGDPDLATGPIALVLGWVVREATTNVLRHAHAARCEIALGTRALTVSDDGDGRLDRRDGNGIRGMRERVATAGGALEVRPSASGGTTVEVTW